MKIYTLIETCQRNTAPILNSTDRKQCENEMIARLKTKTGNDYDNNYGKGDYWDINENIAWYNDPESNDTFDWQILEILN